MVVSVEEKVPPDGISCGSERRAQANHPMRCRKIKDDVKTGGYPALFTKAPRVAPCATGQANSQFRQGLTTSLGSSIPMIEPSSISASASRWSSSFLQSALSKAPLRNASLGQARWQGMSQPLHGSKSRGPVGSSPASMKIPRRRTRVPYSGVTRIVFADHPQASQNGGILDPLNPLGTTPTHLKIIHFTCLD